MASYHPFLFLLIAMLAIVEVGLTAWFVDHFDDTAWPSDRFHSLIILFLCTSSRIASSPAERLTPGCSHGLLDDPVRSRIRVVDL